MKPGAPRPGVEKRVTAITEAMMSSFTPDELMFFYWSSIPVSLPESWESISQSSMFYWPTGKSQATKFLYYAYKHVDLLTEHEKSGQELVFIKKHVADMADRDYRNALIFRYPIQPHLLRGKERTELREAAFADANKSIHEGHLFGCRFISAIYWHAEGWHKDYYGGRPVHTMKSIGGSNYDIGKCAALGVGYLQRIFQVGALASENDKIELSLLNGEDHQKLLAAYRKRAVALIENNASHGIVFPKHIPGNLLFAAQNALPPNPEMFHLAEKASPEKYLRLATIRETNLLFNQEFEAVTHDGQPVSIASTPVLAYYIAEALAENG